MTRWRLLRPVTAVLVCLWVTSVAGPGSPAQVVWKALRDVPPGYWTIVFPGEFNGGW